MRQPDVEAQQGTRCQLIRMAVGRNAHAARQRLQKQRLGALLLFHNVAGFKGEHNHAHVRRAQHLNLVWPARLHLGSFWAMKVVGAFAVSMLTRWPGPRADAQNRFCTFQVAAGLVTPRADSLGA